jgi:hypothetical protein
MSILNGEEKNRKFKFYSQKLSDATDNIPLEHAIRSHHKGLPRWRDRFVFMKSSLIESLSYFSIVLSMITFTALAPQSVKNINGFFTYLGSDYQLPVEFSTIAMVVIVIFICCFGIVAYRFFGLAKSANEIANRYSPVNYLIFNELQDLKDDNKKLREELKVFIGAEKEK